MIEEQALLSTIVADPDNDRPRMVYADWLEEHGEPDRAELVGLLVRLGQNPRALGLGVGNTAVDVRHFESQVDDAVTVPAVVAEVGAVRRDAAEDHEPGRP